jgi:Cu/Zn superoxide dismutase
MTNIDGLTSKRAIGVGLILLSLLTVLSYSLLGNPPSASAVVSLQSRRTIQPQTNLKHSASGKADVVWDAKQNTLTVAITISGLAPNSKHPAHIHKGSCDTSDKGVIYPLNDVVADSGGASISKTTILQV